MPVPAVTSAAFLKVTVIDRLEVGSTLGVGPAVATAILGAGSFTTVLMVVVALEPEGVTCTVTFFVLSSRSTS